MKVTTVIDTDREEEVVIYTHGDSDVAERIRRAVCECDELLGYRGEEILRLRYEDVFCFFAERGHTYALTAGGRCAVRIPLYKIEESAGRGFVRISQSCIVAVSAITSFKASVGGSLAVVLKGGQVEYVSRRQLKSVKERFGIK